MQSAFRVRVAAGPSSAFGAGDPSPEGVHQDAAELTAVLLIDRRNVSAASGASRVWSLAQPCGKVRGRGGGIEEDLQHLLTSVVLEERFDTLFVLDREVKHEALPILARDATRDARRDVLTFEIRRPRVVTSEAARVV